MSRGDPLRVRDYLEHIAQAIANIQEYTAGMDAAAYLADRKTQDAVVRNFEVIGAACNNVIRYHAEFAASHTEIPWNFAYEMRNALAHGYFKIDQGIVWRTIEVDLPALAKALHAALHSSPPA
jgi:uncharacterized protein with HEPN domain